VAITNTDLNELLAAIQACGDIDVVRQGVELMVRALIDEATAPDRCRPLRADEQPDDPAQRHPGPIARDEYRRRGPQDPQAPPGQGLFGGQPRSGRSR
jgi:hypothetical protein